MLRYTCKLLDEKKKTIVLAGKGNHVFVSVLNLCCVLFINIVVVDMQITFGNVHACISQNVLLLFMKLYIMYGSCKYFTICDLVRIQIDFLNMN